MVRGTKKATQLPIIRMVDDNDLMQTEQEWHQQGIAMQSFVFGHSKHSENNANEKEKKQQETKSKNNKNKKMKPKIDKKNQQNHSWGLKVSTAMCFRVA